MGLSGNKLGGEVLTLWSWLGCRDGATECFSWQLEADQTDSGGEMRWSGRRWRLKSLLVSHLGSCSWWKI